MKKITCRFWILALCVFTLGSCSKESLDEGETSDLVSVVAPVSYNEIELNIMDLVNDYRFSKGLNELDYKDEVSWQAEDHNFYMIQKNKVSHDGFANRYSSLAESVDAKAVSENVAFGYNTAEAVVKAWIESEGHRKNMEGDLTHFGISVKEDANGKKYFTNIFVRI
ncbi:hypothetical protein GCM10007103_16380 [Salinimicrobium marinum]|uniref:SCP domain-containing protein n=1 Tax=Salinimicrobium marinum TaxID=680283 RepID=A0A918SF19_9FLAO|nr:CAP domain-containing protein [Salinimicrobium marinum]GHA35513.1 hypothetical protein GCM10007103_16380 [Salinimicrobium marinum]